MKMKSVLKILGAFCLGGTLGAVITAKVKNHNLKIFSENDERLRSNYNTLNQWLASRIAGESLKEYFVKNNYFHIAVYGVGSLGQLLLEELKNTPVKAEYGIDKNASYTFSDMEVFYPEQNLPAVDAVIVTAEYDIDHIKEFIGKKYNYPVIPLSQIIREI